MSIRCLKYRLYVLLSVLGFLGSSNYLLAQEKNLLFYNSEEVQIQGYAQAGLNFVAETNLFWNLADVPELDYDSDTEWIESYLKPGVGFKYSLNTNTNLYAKISLVGSSTLGTDAFNEGNTGRITLEETHIGFKTNLSDSIIFHTVIGAQELKLGTGMLIANGGSSGFERGALKFGPRKAWQRSVLIEVDYKKLNGKVFYLSPNELPSNDTNNKLVGADISINASNKYIGVSYVNVLASDAPYPKVAQNGQGAPIITSGDREDLNALNLYTRNHPFKGKLKNFFMALDIAYQWNSRINLTSWGGRIQTGYDLSKIKWKPTLMYTYQVFSGDDPNTEAQERFDPLYFEGSPSAWSTGSKSSMVFINSNVQSHGLSIRLQPKPKDIITFRYSHIRAQQLQSPIQFGQAARVEFSDGIPTVVAGVTNKHLADDFFIEYNKVITQNIYVNAGFSLSIAGKGIENIVGDTSLWTGAFLNVVFNY
ncbi:hypothetical protein ATO12_23145 [Aquimarina atlantica]|uniref:Uncharacterized protein n=1 Tax=Aquimarina atlantica TaxID=1317122 RepID=A0A023BQM2_9FLAO|nr:hypothetical protein [Aquimarina atlantica]EZH72352.1 hypothetical protein ATO12_23145 [Aquimarina atlantica]